MAIKAYKTTVLFIDDDKEILKNYRDFFSEFPAIKAMFVESAIEAIKAMKLEHYDYVVLDSLRTDWAKVTGLTEGILPVTTIVANSGDPNINDQMAGTKNRVEIANKDLDMLLKILGLEG